MTAEHTKDSSNKKEKEPEEQKRPEPTKEDLILMLKYSIESFERLPPEALNIPVTQFDLLNAMMIIYAIFRK